MPGRAVGRKVRDAEEARDLLGQWSKSGEPMSAWCGRRGLSWYSLSAYQGWRVRSGRAVERVPGDGLVEVVRPRATRTATATEYRVAVGDWVVEVGGNFDDETLRRLLRVVASC